MVQNPVYIGILKSGDALSEVFPHLKIIDDEIFSKAQEIRIQRSNKYEPLRRLPLRTKGESLLSGNIFCGSCSGRLTLTTNGTIYTNKNGEQINKKRIRYICYNKSRKIIPCDGQTGYTTHKLNDIISLLLANLFKSIKDTPENTLIEKRYQSELAISTKKLKSARVEHKKPSDSLKTLQNEVVNAIQGTSKFDSVILNDLIKQTTEKLTTAQNEITHHESELENKQQHMTNIQTQYHNLINWADIFMDCEKETKKMIEAYLIESVRVSRNYELEIRFNVAYEQFCSMGNMGNTGNAEQTTSNKLEMA